GGYRCLLSTRVYGTISWSRSRRSGDLRHRLGIRGLSRDHLASPSWARASHWNIVLRLATIRRIHIDDFDSGSHAVRYQRQDRLVTGDGSLHLRRRSRLAVAGWFRDNFGNTPARCLRLL